MALKANKKLLLIIKLVISSSLLYYVLSKAGVEKVLFNMKQISPFAFILSTIIYVVSLYVSTVRWRLLMPEELKGKKLFSFYLIGAFFNTFLPGAVGGDAVKSYYLYKETSRGSLSLASVFMDRYVGFISMMILGLIAFILGFNYLKGTVIEWLLPVIILSFLVASFIIFGLRFGKGIKILGELYEYFDKYRNRKRLIVKAILLSFVVQIMSTISMYVISRGLGQNMQVIYFFIFFPIIVTISTLPISISGIGVRESMFVLLFGLVGISHDMATTMSFAWFLSIAFGGLAGFVEYLRLKR